MLARIPAGDAAAPLIGVFVGGRARRMGGVPKGNLELAGRTILERTLDVCRPAFDARHRAPIIYLVGESSAYRAEGVRRLADDPAGVGPLGGLRALLLETIRRGARSALALAGDMPFLTRPLLERLWSERPDAAALAPREDGRWHPLFARYRASDVLPHVDAALAAGQTSLQIIFERLALQAAVMALSGSERDAIVDWDRPSDVTGQCRK